MIERTSDHRDWCARLEDTVQAKCANLAKQPSGPPADPWSSAELAKRARKEIRAALRGMPDHQANVLWALLMAIGPNYHGCDTPAEEFVSSLGTLYLFSLMPKGHGVTPSDVAGELEKFEGDFRDAVQLARTFSAKYAAEVSGDGAQA